MVIFSRLLHYLHSLQERPRVGTALVLGLLALSVLGNAVCFHVFDGRHQGLGFDDALWYSVISITTIGYGDFSASSPGARLGTVIFIVILGLSSFTVFLGMAIDQITQFALRGRFGMREVLSRDHVVIVNHPSEARVRGLIQELRHDAAHSERDVVVVSDSLQQLPFSLPNVHFVRGPLLESETYERAGVERAKMVIVLGTADPSTSDAVVASAVSVIKRLAPAAQVVAECLSVNHRKLFEGVGVNAIVPGQRICDNLLVQEVQDPGISRMVDVLTSNLEGDTLFSCGVETEQAITDYRELAKRLLDGNVNLLAVVRGRDSLTTFSGVDPEPGDRLIYVASERWSWSRMLELLGDARQ